MSKAFRVYVRASAAIILGTGGATYATSASACGDGLAAQHAAWQDEQSGDLSTLFRQADAASSGNHAIVGMWAFKMAASGGFTDFGYQQWHSDGTEFMNSGGRAPATQNYCLGVWTQTAPLRYHLNHFALSYDPSGTLNAKINIKEDVALDKSGANYSGTFSIDVYDPNSGARLQHLAGEVTAQRVPAN